MHGDYSPWAALAQMPDVRVEYGVLDGELGWWDPDRRVITLAVGQTQAERRCTLAHELEHAQRNDEDTSEASPVLAVRQEIAASARAARKLIPLPALIRALLFSSDETEIAEELHVDVDTVRIRLMTMTTFEHAIVDERLWRAEGRMP